MCQGLMSQSVYLVQNIKAGTVDSLLRGGLLFSTLTNEWTATVGRWRPIFYLYPQAEDEWKSWEPPYLALSELSFYTETHDSS